MADLDRAGFLRLGVAGAVAAGAGVLAATAGAALPTAAPQGDDVGFLAFGATAELTSLAWYRRAAAVRGFPGRDRRRLAAAAATKLDHVNRMNAVLGPDGVAEDDFAAVFPRGTLRTPARALALGQELELLLVSMYVNGAAFAGDPATRLMLGRLLTYDAQQLAWLRGLRGHSAAGGLPTPLGVEEAGTRLDRLITTPAFTR